MKSSLPTYTYLYGYTPETIKNIKTMPYEDALKDKIHMAMELNKRLFVPDFMNRDNTRINDIQKAIKFNTQLLKELK